MHNGFQCLLKNCSIDFWRVNVLIKGKVYANQMNKIYTATIQYFDGLKQYIMQVHFDIGFFYWKPLYDNYHFYETPFTRPICGRIIFEYKSMAEF